MYTLFPYLIKVNLVIIVLYGFFRLFFQQDTFFRFKRITLLFIFFISLLFPFIDFSGSLSQNELMSRVLADNIPVFALPEVVITPNQGSPKEVIISNLSILLYLAGGAILLFLMLVQIISIVVNIYKSRRADLLGIAVCISEKTQVPFSFFKWIVLAPGSADEKDLHEILLHEKTHAEQNHSLDVLCCELMCAFCWFNPFIWLMKREIRMNLEYLADRSVLESGCDSEHYQYHLLRLSYQKAAANLSNNFNVSPLKKRIKMMNKKKTSYLGLTKYTLFVPLVAALLLVSNAQAVSNMAKEMKEVTGIEALPEVETSSVIVENDSIFKQVEAMPQFPGGDQELFKFLATNIRYPADAQQNGMQGMVVVQFVVDKDGQISGTKLIRSLYPSCDNEAIRVVNAMPKWTPGKHNGKAVSVYYTLPVKFRLTGSGKKETKPQASSEKEPEPSVIVTGYAAE